MRLNHPERQRNVEPSGSPQPGEPVYLIVGKIRRSHGLKGELLMEMVTDLPTNLKPGTPVLLGEQKIPAEVSSLRQANSLWLISLAGFEDAASVENFRNQWIYVEKKNLKPLPHGRFYQYQVIGMKVFNEERNLLGEVTEILVTGANDVYVVKSPSGSEILMPAINSVILNIDPEKGEIVAKPQEWS